MHRKRLCIVCHKNPAEVPDREAMGKPIKRVCMACHERRLADDLSRISDMLSVRCCKCGKRKRGVRIESPLGYSLSDWCWDCYQDDLRAMLNDREEKPS